MDSYDLQTKGESTSRLITENIAIFRCLGCDIDNSYLHQRYHPSFLLDKDEDKKMRKWRTANIPNMIVVVYCITRNYFHYKGPQKEIYIKYILIKQEEKRNESFCEQ